MELLQEEKIQIQQERKELEIERKEILLLRKEVETLIVFGIDVGGVLVAVFLVALHSYGFFLGFIRTSNTTIIELMEGEQAQTISIERGKYSYPHRTQGSALGQKIPPMYYKSTTDCSTPRSILSLLNRGMVGLNNLYQSTAVISSGTKTMKIK